MVDFIIKNWNVDLGKKINFILKGEKKMKYEKNALDIPKKRKTLYLYGDVFDELKKRDYNISEVCNAALVKTLVESQITDSKEREQHKKLKTILGIKKIEEGKYP